MRSSWHLDCWPAKPRHVGLIAITDAAQVDLPSLRELDSRGITYHARFQNDSRLFWGSLGVRRPVRAIDRKAQGRCRGFGPELSGHPEPHARATLLVSQPLRVLVSFRVSRHLGSGAARTKRLGERTRRSRRRGVRCRRLVPPRIWFAPDTAPAAHSHRFVRSVPAPRCRWQHGLTPSRTDASII
jgi:hypothetical protein